MNAAIVSFLFGAKAKSRQSEKFIKSLALVKRKNRLAFRWIDGSMKR